MLAEFLGTIGRLISLIDRKEKDDADLFRSIIDPAYKSFCATAQDFMDIFTRCSEALQDKSLDRETLQAIFIELREKRKKLRTERSRLSRELAHLSAAISQLETKHLLMKMSRFFYASKAEWDIGASAGGHLIELWGKTIKDGINQGWFDQEYLGHFLEDVIKEQNQKFTDITERYSEIKSRLGTPVRYRQKTKSSPTIRYRQ
jgi:hypothetical protein